MKKQPIKTTCKNCSSPIKQDGVKSFKRCPVCGVKWQFRMSDGGLPELYEGKKTKLSAEDRKRHYPTSLSPRERKEIDAAGYGVTQLTQAGYCLLVLKMDVGDVMKLYNVAV